MKPFNPPTPVQEGALEHALAVRDALEAAFQGAIGRLSGIENDLRQLIAAEAQSSENAPFSRFLAQFRAEIERQQQEVQRLLEQLDAGIAGLNESGARAEQPVRPTSPVRMDPVTGLPDRAAAEIAIATAIAEHRSVYAAAFAVDRLDMIVSRFGAQAGDQVFHLFTRDLASKLAKEDRLYRWDGPTLVALIESTQNLAGIRGEMFRITAHRFSTTFDVGSRCALLSLGASANVIALSGSTAEAAVSAIDAFLRVRSPRAAK